MEPPDKISDITEIKILDRLQPTWVLKKEAILDNRIWIVKLRPKPARRISYAEIICWPGWL